jgi:hypothetical protein
MSKKEKLKDVKTGSLGMGDAYAYAVKGIIDESKSKQGSNQAAWLGKSKVTIDPKKCVDSKILCGRKK